MNLASTDVARFWAAVTKTADCWLWNRGKTGSGYGAFYLNGRTLRAHRVSWEMAHGIIDAGMMVLHACDIPACVNPAHLMLGTAADNSADMVGKGRQARGESHGFHLHPERVASGERHGSVTHPESLARGDRNGSRKFPERRPRGERHPNAKLNSEQVAIIRSSSTPAKELAERLGVCWSRIYRIRNGDAWRGSVVETAKEMGVE